MAAATGATDAHTALTSTNSPTAGTQQNKQNIQDVKRPYIPFTALCLFVIITMTMTGCGADKNLKKGEKYLAIGEYYDAATQFKQAYSRTSPKERERRGQIALKIAYCNERINASQKAMAAYSNAIR